MAAIRLWQRDLDIIREAERSPLLTDHLRKLHGFPSNKKATERLCSLYRAGFLKRAPYFQPAKQGKPSFLYFVGARPRPRTLHHTVGIANVMVQAVEWVRASPGVAVDFYYGREVHVSGGILPDGAFVVRKADRTGLFFLEVDNGTEIVTSMRGYSLASKLRAYAAYFDAGLYEADFAWVGPLRGFRVALIVPAGRLRHVQDLIASEGHDFVLTTTFDQLRNGIGRPVWHAADRTVVDLLGRRGDMTGELMGEMVEPTLPTRKSPNVFASNDFALDGEAENPNGLRMRTAGEEEANGR